MNKLVLLLMAVAVCGALICPQVACTQPVSGGVRADVASASFQNADYSIDPRVGMRAGAFFDLILRGPVDFRAEAVYSMKGVKSPINGGATIKLDYIEVPIMAKVLLGHDSGFMLLTGPYMGIKVSSKRISGSESIDYGDLVYAFDFGWVAGLGYEMSLGGRNVTFDARYSMGLRSVFDFGDPSDTDSDDKNRVISAGVGVGLFYPHLAGE